MRASAFLLRSPRALSEQGDEPQRLRTGAAIAVITVLAMVAMVGGCSLSRPAPVKQSYLLNATRDGAAKVKAFPGALRVNRFTVAQSFNGRAMVYRADDQRFEVDFYNEFLALPATMMTERTTSWLSASRLFESVVPMTSGMDTRYLLEAEVTDFYGDFRQANAPRAVLAARFYLAQEGSGHVLYERAISRSVTIDDPSAPQLVRGLERALSETLGELEADLMGLASKGPAAEASPGGASR